MKLPQKFDLSSYDYKLPQELIAQYPSKRRDKARLLHLTNNAIEDTVISQLPKFVNKGDLLVINDTKVIPMRLIGTKNSGGKVEILVNRIFNSNNFEAMIKSSRPAQINSRIFIDEQKDISLTVMEINKEFYNLKLVQGKDIHNICKKYGKVPLPVYIKRSVSSADSGRYQTVYAKKPGAAAAPTAGLHLNKRLLAQLKKKGVNICKLTLHCGAGTFAPIRENDIRKHQIHYEWCEVSQNISDKLNQTRQSGKNILAVGTTCLRALETSLNHNKDASEFSPYYGWTNAYFYPAGPPIKAVDMLLTNFHIPRSSLFLLVCAFSGYDNIIKAYQHAIKNKYRFFSFGDAMLLHHQKG